MMENKEKIPLRNVIAVKFWYVLGLFTIIYLGVLTYDLAIGLIMGSENTALIVIGISVSISIIDLVLLLKDKVSPAMIAMVLWISPLIALYKLFKHTDLLNINSSSLPKKIKQYTFSARKPSF